MRRAPRAELRWLVLLGVALVLLAAAAAEAVMDSSRSQDLNDRAVEVQPPVQTIRNDDGKTLARFAFHAEGRQVQGELRVVAQTKVGDRLDVRYEPGNPSRHWLDGHDPPGTETWILAPAVVPALACLWLWHRKRPRAAAADVP